MSRIPYVSEQREQFQFNLSFGDTLRLRSRLSAKALNSTSRGIACHPRTPLRRHATKTWSDLVIRTPAATECFLEREQTPAARQRQPRSLTPAAPNSRVDPADRHCHRLSAGKPQSNHGQLVNGLGRYDLPNHSRPFVEAKKKVRPITLTHRFRLSDRRSPRLSRAQCERKSDGYANKRRILRELNRQGEFGDRRRFLGSGKQLTNETFVTVMRPVTTFFFRSPGFPTCAGRRLVRMIMSMIMDTVLMRTSTTGRRSNDSQGPIKSTAPEAVNRLTGDDHQAIRDQQRPGQNRS